MTLGRTNSSGLTSCRRARQSGDVVCVARRPLRSSALARLLAGIVSLATVGANMPAAGGAASPQEPGADVTAAEANMLREARQLAESGPAAAIALLTAGVTPESSPALFDALGVYCERSEQLAEAEKHYRRALERRPDSLRYGENVARILLRQEKYDEAAERLRALVARAPHLAWARMSLARLCLRGEEYRAAAAHLVALLDSDLTAADATVVSHKGEVWKLLGYAHSCQTHYAAAETAFRQALVYAPEDTALRMQLIHVVMKQSRYAEARTLVETELATDPLRPELWRLLAGVNCGEEKSMYGLIELECAHRLGIAAEEDLVDLGDLMMNEGFAAPALQRYLAAAALDDPPVPRLLRAAQAFLSLVQPTRALTVLEHSSEAGRAFTLEQQRQADTIRAQAAEMLGDQDRALTMYEALLADKPLDARLLMAAGKLLQQQGKLEDALIHFERAARADPAKRASALVCQAQIAIEQDDYARADRLLRESLQVEHRAHVERYLRQVRQMLD